MAKNKRTSDDRRKKLQELVEERNQDANSFFSGKENVTRENIQQKRKEDSNNFKKESSKRKNISSSSSQKSNYSNYTNNSNDNDYELPMINNNNENRFQLPTVNRLQMPTMNFQSRARRNSSFTGINLDENNLKFKQKETSRKVFETLNPGKKISYTNNTEYELPTKDKVKNILRTGLIEEVKQSPSKLLHIAKSTIGGGVSGTAGIAQASLSQSANQQEKGSKSGKGQTALNILSVLYPNLPVLDYNLTKEFSENFYNTLNDKEKNTLQKAGSLITEIGSYASNQLSSNRALNAIEQIRGKISPSISKKYMELYDKISNPVRKMNQKIAEEREGQDILTQKLGEAGQSMGNMAPSLAVTALTKNPTAGMMVMGESAKGQATDEALQKGADLNTATKIGDVKKELEIGTEMLTGGLKFLSPVGSTTIDNAVENLINNKIHNRMANFFTKQLAGIGGEIAEETISDVVGTIIDKGTVDPDATYTWNDWWNTVTTTALSTAGLNTVTGGYTSKAYKQNAYELQQHLTKEALKQNIADSQVLTNEEKTQMTNYLNNNDITEADFNAMKEKMGINPVQEQAKQEITSRMNNNQQVNNVLQEQISSLVERIDKSNLPNEDKLMMKDYIQNNNVSQADIDSMNNVIDSSVVLPANNELVTNQNFKDNIEVRKKYSKYKNDTGEYNSKAIDEVLDLIPENRNGNRTVKQWLQVAKETGTRIADLSNEEIERIAYKSWFDVQPSKNITKYDRQTKSTAGFQKLTSDEWVNEINKAVNEARTNNQTQNVANNQENNKQKQLDIIQENNPMTDNYHTGIRNVEDIKTFDEVINDEESFVYGDFSKEDAEKALKEGKVTVYSSNPIEQGSFVSTSQNMAKDYAGNGKIYSQEVDLKDVAWINGDEGQYAKVENNLTNNQENIKNGNLLYDIDKGVIKRATGERLQLPIRSNSFVDTNNNVSTSNNIIPPITENFKSDSTNYTQNTENNTQTKGESINWNEIERPEGKFRKHYQSIIQSSNTTAQAKAIARELMEADTYIPESNKNQLLRADERIQTNGADKELTTLSTNVDNGSKITSVDIAVGERLIEYYSKIGNKAKLQEAIQTTAMAGTQAGQTVQALALLNHQTPQGQVTWIQRSVDKLNKELKHKKGDKAKQFEFTPEMQQKILKAKDNQEMNNVIDEVYQELGQQVPKSFIEKLDSWRYFSMLANPRTHIRNIVGNFAMGKMQGVKNKVAGAIEDTMSLVNKDMERTHTLKRASKETKQFAKNDLNNVDIQTRLELNENKYNPKSRIENSQRTFKSDALEKTIGKAFNFNDTALEAEDGFGLKHAYVKALSEYMTANKLTPETITEKQLAKARNHAIEEAKEATFHSKNAIATAINQFSRKNKLTKYTTDAILPFVKTPMNVAKAGLEYNPTGLIKTLTVDSVKLRKGNISVNKYIDNLSKGLTGTGLAVLGYAMAKAGILKASGGDDDKKEKYDEALGRQAYSLEINGKTFSLDWLAPAGIPLFVGAEAQNIKSQGEKEKKSISSDDDSKSKQIMESLENWANAMSNSISPMSEMSMISGLTSALKSYDNDSQKMLGTMATNSLKSYVNQFVPTALGQLARTTDEYERNTTSTKTGVLSKPIDQVKLQVMSKIPGLRQKLPTKSDIWGNEVKQQANIPFRAFNNFVNPSIIKDVSINEVDKELNSLYSKTRESSIIPKSIDKTFTIDGENYRMTNEEYAKYNKKYGETSYNLIKGLVTSNDYKNLTDEQKQKAIESVYSYAKEQNKVDYAKENNKEIKQSALYETMKALESKGGNQSNYLEFISKTSGADIKERQKVNTLYNADYDKNTKDIIYSNTIGKDDEIYNKVKKDNVSINSYLKYKDAVYNETDKKRNLGELEKEQNLKSVDKIKILLNSNFSENEKKSLYSNAIADDDVYSKLLKENINVNEYLNFKKAQLNEKLASDKDKYGQAIRGTSKEKFFKYINSKISGYENKLIIAGKNYKLSNKERQKLVDIINSNTEEGKERINMYKNFSRNFIVNGNNVFYK